MDLEDNASTVTRRRGAELETAILDAAWDQLLERGYAGLTFEAVADRAGTSRPVLYRRWSTRGELLRAAIAHRGRQVTVDVPDTGNLRDDVLAALRDMNATRADFVVMMASSLGEYFAEGDTSPREVRALFVGDRVSIMPTLIDRAVARGEIDPAHVTERAVALPADLYRYEVLMSLAPVSDDVLRGIVDDVFLPLVQPGGAPASARSLRRSSDKSGSSGVDDVQ
ncbi:TetR/AcrR family transcriptional regulator [Gordonia otitidis]|uniref:TetR/AcrR family transcriptional regulator n=1 Tax=Gordonia otitidis TaxID=249058 RepID=UPI001D14D0DF|nr:TetR/AcrR family transcriptional regulator [Gordonia otitidis]UEA59797.1 TetR/AcrR family transcriptional regulator [Gordonia otitidis]